MGIKHLHQFLRKHCPEVYTRVPFSKYAFHQIAIDVSIFMCKFKNLYGNRFLDAFIQLIGALRNSDVHMICVYDQKAPPEKDRERQMRMELRERNKARIQRLRMSWDRMLRQIQERGENLFFIDRELLALKFSSHMDWLERLRKWMDAENENENENENDEGDENENDEGDRALFFKFLDHSLGGSDFFVSKNRREEDTEERGEKDGVDREGGGEEFKSALSSLFATPAPTLMEWIEKNLQKLENSLVSISSKDFLLTKELFGICEIPTLDAAGEAEATCALLVNRGFVSAVLTEDTDVLAYGSRYMLHGLHLASESWVEVDLQQVLSRLQLSYPQWLDFCILCGTDYNPNLPRIGPEKAFQLIRTHGSIDRMAQIMDVSVLKHRRVQELFSANIPVGEIIVGPRSFPCPRRIPYCGIPDEHRLRELLFMHNCRVDVSQIMSAFRESVFHQFPSRVLASPSISEKKGERAVERLVSSTCIHIEDNRYKN